MRRTHVQSLSVRGGAEVTLEDSRPPDDAVWGIHLELGVRPCRSAAATSRMRQPSLTERLSAVTSSDAGVRFRELHMMMLCLRRQQAKKRGHFLYVARKTLCSRSSAQFCLTAPGCRARISGSR